MRSALAVAVAVAPALLTAQSPADSLEVVKSPVAVATESGTAVGPTIFGATAGPVRALAALQRVGVGPQIDTRRERGPEFGVRLLAGGFGAVVGGVAGALIGTTAGAGRGGEDPGLAEGIVGAAAGVAVGAAVGAALPARGSGCSTAARFGVGLLGASAGVLVGAVAGARSSTVLVAVPVAAALGAAGAATWC